MAVEKSMASSSLVEVVDRILDKGIVIDAWVRVSLVGIELPAVEARGVTAGGGTFREDAEGVGARRELMGLIQELQRADVERRREVAALSRAVASRIGDFRKGDAQRRRE